MNNLREISSRFDTFFANLPEKKRWEQPNCNKDNSYLFFADELRAERKKRAAEAAIALCQTCPFYDADDRKNICLNYALKHHESQGIWGGKTPKERKIAGQSIGLFALKNW